MATPANSELGENGDKKPPQIIPSRLAPFVRCPPSPSESLPDGVRRVGFREVDGMSDANTSRGLNGLRVVLLNTTRSMSSIGGFSILAACRYGLPSVRGATAVRQIHVSGLSLSAPTSLLDSTFYICTYLFATTFNMIHH